ncbi:MAG: SBBP repeat-containing protein [Spirochaetales bacterium]|nr:SBBP repeat-containing protein [Spirochaetales bacterium]
MKLKNTVFFYFLIFIIFTACNIPIDLPEEDLVDLPEGTPVDLPEGEALVEYSTDANLISLVTDKGILNPVFSPETNHYRIELMNAETINVTGITSDIMAKITYTPDQACPLNLGENLITLTVTAENSLTNSYEILVNQSKGWNSFLGGTGSDNRSYAAVDLSGNIYIEGTSTASWGSPLGGYSGNGDIFIAKISRTGVLLWSTFIGGSGTDTASGISTDSSGNVYITGTSSASWSAPVIPYSGGKDAFAAKLDSDGALLWSTFLGSSSGTDTASGISADPSGNVYISGTSNYSWSAPLYAHTGAGNDDAFAVKLDSDGARIWSTFLGSSGTDTASGISAGPSGNVYLTGTSSASWSSPVSSYAGGNDAFAAKLDSDGALLWSTFLGSSGTDTASGISAGPSGNVYIAGTSSASWSSPVSAYAGGNDAFAAKLDSNGALLWSTFLGGSGTDTASGISADPSGNVYIAGTSSASWLTPVRAYSGGNDAFAVKLESNGNRIWNTFHGGSLADTGSAVIIDSDNSIVLTGDSSGTWGVPISNYSGNTDVFISRIDSSGRFTDE